MKRDIILAGVGGQGILSINPPFRGHGGMSYAPSVASVIEVCNTLKQYEEK